MVEQTSSGGQNFLLSKLCDSGACIGVNTDSVGKVSVSKVTNGSPVGSVREHTPLAWTVRSKLVAFGAPTSLVTPKDGFFDHDEKQIFRAALRAGEFRLPPQRKPVQARMA